MRCGASTADAADRRADHGRRQSVGARTSRARALPRDLLRLAQQDRLRSRRCAARTGVSSERLVCIFDDVNDLGMAFGCGIRVLVQRSASPLLRDYVVRQGLCDYVTGARAASGTPCARSASCCSACSAPSMPSSRRASHGIATTRAYLRARARPLTTEFVDQTRERLTMSALAHRRLSAAAVRVRQSDLARTALSRVLAPLAGALRLRRAAARARRVIWVHAVSVGEVRSAAPLVERARRAVSRSIASSSRR